MDLIPFVAFVLAMTGTPGPGNLTMMAVGQATGYKSALPLLFGSGVGFAFINLSVAFGLGQTLAASPAWLLLLKIVGTAYILYLAWKVINIKISEGQTAKRFTFWEGVLIHCTSPKSWAMSMVGFTQFALPQAGTGYKVVSFVLIFALLQLCFHSIWGLAGSWLVGLLKSPRTRLATNSVAAGLMVVATLYALLS